MRRIAIFAAALLVGACAAGPATVFAPAPGVVAVGQTEPVGTVAADAADDPAIWRNAADPAASLIVGTDKKAGLHVYDLAGRSRHFTPAGRVNNVDLVTLADGRVIVVASDRNDLSRAVLRLYRLDTANAALVPLGAVPGGLGEAYGVCLRAVGDALVAASVLKDGTIIEQSIAVPADSPPVATPLRRLKLATQTEGCVIDPRDGTLYVGEEDRGIWRFAPGSTTPTMVAAVDGRQLVADVEGLDLVPEGTDGGVLVASSQGDNAYAVWRLPAMAPIGRFRVVAGTNPGGPIGGAEETDGIAVAARGFGAPYPDGLMVVQDGMNAPQAQNFKLLSWADVRAALGF